MVEIMVGPDKGKQGHVNYIVEERNWICVEGLNCKYSTVGKEKDYPGMMVKEEKPLLVTNEVKLVDPSDNKPTDVEWRFLEDGSKIRISTRTGREIPIPLQNEETIDYKTKATYKELSVDFSTWISLIHNLWTKDGLLDDPRCTYYNLCEMAHLAHKKGGQGEYAAALSTIPLSYLLHSRHQAGFISFSSAAGSGYMGENCSTLYTGCDSLGSY
ncbi:hypothetical protein QYM36_017243 [Artemia franciscana]|uniref:Large ribosomal subunit protein uL24 C-terminal domain-containing protein n=1 Tax=Artemia franciscana TaxID=6661 RepID=A0AA88KVJ2_ARTSF|nr:hypothetical protein QYM36_017243 [Artemia franciscana]